MTVQRASELVEHFFRHESANLVAVLTRAFGIHRIELVEDTVQTAMLEAMQVWQHGRLPDNPAGWIHRVARNRLLDVLRRQEAFSRAIAQTPQIMEEKASQVEQWLSEERLPDSLLRMMFACCHPLLDRKSQIALTLKTLCGFSIAEVARGLFLPAETVKKRIQRAKKSLASNNVGPDIPNDEGLVERLSVVHDVLYLLFNEGYSTSNAVEPIRDDICEEAARLCHLLCESRYGSTTTRALLALMLFQSSRLDARTDESGAVVLLADQDRTKWDHALIAAGQHWLSRAKTDQLTEYHLEAAIAMQHCVAVSVETTDWEMVAQLYGRLRQHRESPVYALNQAVAIGQTGRTKEALQQLQRLRAHPRMLDYPLLECSMARIYELQGDTKNAADCYRAALAKRPAPHEEAVIVAKLRRLQSD